MGEVKVSVKSAANIPGSESSKANPYVLISFKGYRKKTSSKNNDLNPFWDENFVFALREEKVKPDDTILFQVFSRERFGADRLLCFAQEHVPKDCVGVEKELELLNSNNEKTDAKIIVSVEYRLEKDNLEDENEEEGEGNFRRNRTRTGGHNNFNLAKIGAAIESLPTKAEDLQLRVSIIKAQSLIGIKINPVARVDCSDQMRQTRVLDNTNSPFWGETFFFNLHMSLADLALRTITFSVYNSRLLRKDAIIGVFKCSLSVILENESNAITNKWLLISDPNDSLTAGAKGYLKVSVLILRAGDTVPTAVDVLEDESDDIESNLLRPAGMQLKLATFFLRLLRGEDFPLNVSNSLFSSKSIKTPTNACLLFKFAGIKSYSSIKYGEANPEWNEELKFGLHWPSMCSGVCLRVLEGDRKVNEESPIGTTFLQLSNISSDGFSKEGHLSEIDPEGDSSHDGFLPTFGPSYIILYGSPRDLPRNSEAFCELNRGKGEGVAYRGRILVELGLSLGACPSDRCVPISKEHLCKYQLFMRRRKFILYAAFACASLLSIEDAPVQFEVSMGNFGDFFSSKAAPSSSLTQSSSPVFDGSHYYYLPWQNENPCCALEVSWEDISYRLFSINILLKICDRLSSNMDKIRIAMKAKLPDFEQARFVISALDELCLQCSKNCKFPRHDPNEIPETELDVRWRTIRQSVVNYIKQDALQKRESLKSVEDGLQALEDYLNALKALAFEAQASIPDVFIWLISGGKRIAYSRIAACDIIFSSNYDCCGRYCGLPQTIFLQTVEDDNSAESKIPGVIRVRLWFGDPNDVGTWDKVTTEGKIKQVAEVYENQVYVVGSWAQSGKISRPSWSDESGEVSLSRDDYTLPSGWSWDGDWYLAPRQLHIIEAISGNVYYVEEVFVHQMRTDEDSSWVAATPEFTDFKGEATDSPSRVVCPNGWEWVTEWTVDVKRACDDDGWEYSVNPAMRGYIPVMKNYHLCRRRRMVRTRSKIDNSEVVDSVKLNPNDCWEYAGVFSANVQFHSLPKTLDLVRRRRWHRKLKPSGSNSLCVFRLSGADLTPEMSLKKSKVAAPKIFISIQEHHSWELRAYMYQARDLLAVTDSGFSHPYARVVFDVYSDVTKSIEMSLSPLWDQTLIITGITLGKTVNQTMEHPPHVIVEIFDLDLLLEDRIIARCTITPMVKVEMDDRRQPILQWFDLKLNGSPAGKLLAAFELILIDTGIAPMVPERRGPIYSVPSVIRPFLRRTGIEIVCWGLRKLGQFQLSSIDCPNVEVEIGGFSCQSGKLRDVAKNPNFAEPWLFLDVMLPKEELYMPPLNVRMRDHRSFGRNPIVGSFAITDLDKYSVKKDSQDKAVEVTFIERGFKEAKGGPPTIEDEVPSKMLGAHRQSQWLHHKIANKKKTLSENEMNLVDEDIDWWSKYYASVGNFSRCLRYSAASYDAIKIYDCELESAFSGFNDLLNSFLFKRGSNIDDENDCEVVGEFKGAFKIYGLPEDPNQPLPDPLLKDHLPKSNIIDCTVRIYVLRAFTLQASDPEGCADAYLKISVGRKSVNSRDEYFPNSLNPIFGKMFELNCKLPLEKELTIDVMDRDLILSDELIGRTVIDLENRYLTQHRATVGLPKSYCVTGTNFWRDSMLPTDILRDLCEKYRLAYCGKPGPTSSDTHISVGVWDFTLAQFETEDFVNAHWGAPIERLALHILNTMPLVKEHVETRSIYTSLQPGIEQGKLLMWVDLFPLTLGDPGPAVDISPRQPRSYVLRVIIYNTIGVRNFVNSSELIDLYVRGWIAGIDEAQETDVHYRAVKGDGNFNWRFVFPLNYLPSEGMVVVKSKANFWSMDLTERRIPPKLVLQVWDNDKFGVDDVLGSLDLPLRKVPFPMKSAVKTNLKQIGANAKTMNLFESRRSNGFWPFVLNDPETDEVTMIGSVEMEIQLLTEEEAEKKPAGRGRKDPNEDPTLDAPKRPDTSFLWFVSPYKSFRYIIWRRHKWTLISLTVVSFLTSALLIFFYSFPGQVSQKLVQGT